MEFRHSLLLLRQPERQLYRTQLRNSYRMHDMDLRAALTRQYHLGFAMLRQSVELCPDDLWETGKHPRTYWRIAYHAVYFSDLYLHPSLKSFTPWAEHRKDAQNLWGRPIVHPAYSKAEILAYLDKVDRGVEAAIGELDLEAPKSGFPLYKMPKIELLMLNLRHQQGHIGQLSELLMARGIEVPWLGMG